LTLREPLRLSRSSGGQGSLLGSRTLTIKLTVGGATPDTEGFNNKFEASSRVTGKRTLLGLYSCVEMLLMLFCGNCLNLPTL
jgi:hypothetical protein